MEWRPISLLWHFLSLDRNTNVRCMYAFQDYFKIRLETNHSRLLQDMSHIFPIQANFCWFLSPSESQVSKYYLARIVSFYIKNFWQTTASLHWPRGSTSYNCDNCSQVGSAKNQRPFHFEQSWDSATLQDQQIDGGYVNQDSHLVEDCRGRQIRGLTRSHNQLAAKCVQIELAKHESNRLGDPLSRSIC